MGADQKTCLEGVRAGPISASSSEPGSAKWGCRGAGKGRPVLPWPGEEVLRLVLVGSLAWALEMLSPDTEPRWSFLSTI